MNRLAGLVVAMALAAGGGWAREYPLVTGGKPAARIQMSPEPSAPEFRAAVELQDYIKKISGATVPRATYPPAYYRTVDQADFVELLLITPERGARLLPEKVAKRLAEASSGEAFYLFSEGDRIFIAGKTPIGVYYGAVTFIEKYLGVRWFHAGEEGEVCPKTKDLRVPEIDDFQAPSLPGRYINCWSESVKPWPLEQVRLWQARNKIQFGSRHQYNDRSRDELDFSACGNTPIGGGGHLTFETAVPKRLFKTNPEYFPMKDGTRVCEERSQRCLANPDVQQKVVDYALAMAAYGATYSISFHDSTFECWCQCPECLKMGTYKGAFTVPTLAHRFTSLVADRVLKQNPEAQLSVDIYSVFRDLPADTRLRYDPRVRGRYCPHQRCYVHRLDDPNSECNVKFLKDLKAWQQILPRIGIFDYYAYSKSPYAPMEYVLAEDLKLYARMGIEFWMDDCTNKDLPIPASNWPFYYVAAKLLWDASLDAEALLREAYTLYYGAASEPMLEYHALRRELWESAPGHASYGGPNRIAYCLASPAAEKRLTDCLARAESLAGQDSLLQRRLAMDRRFLAEFWIAGARKIRDRMAGQSDVPVRRREAAVAIDGVLDEADWRGAPLVAGFLTADGAEPAEETRVKVLYDDAAWYVGVEAMTEHAWGPLKADITERDGEVWRDDSVEVFLMPPGGDYYQFVVNSLGTLYDARVRAVAFDSQAEIKTAVLKDRYVVEMRIPAKPMGLALADGQVWRLHVYRSCKNLQPPQTAEGSSLDGTPPHEQTLFRRALIGRSAVANGEFAMLDSVKEGDQRYDSTNFPAHWHGNRAALVAGARGRNRIDCSDYLATYLTVPALEHPQAVAGEVAASGSGTLALATSTCIREPGDKRGFGHDIKRDIGTFVLTETPAALPFRFELAPYEVGYLTFRVKGRAWIDSVLAARTAL